MPNGGHFGFLARRGGLRTAGASLGRSTPNPHPHPHPNPRQVDPTSQALSGVESPGSGAGLAVFLVFLVLVLAAAFVRQRRGRFGNAKQFFGLESGKTLEIETIELGAGKIDLEVTAPIEDAAAGREGLAKNKMLDGGRSDRI